MRQILLTTDFSDESVRAFGAAADLARRLGARITLLHVAVQPVMAATGPGLPVPPPPAVDVLKVMRHARERMRELRPLFGDDVEVELDVATGFDVADVVVEEAHRRGSDLIAMATHGRSGLSRLALGSVADNVMRRARVPVMVVPPTRAS